jgi:predicted nucleic acid-binding protein
MRKSLFIDTSYILALLNAQDEFHRQAVSLADQIDGLFITTEAVLTEIANALAKPQWLALAIDTINNLRDDNDVEVVSITPKLFSKAIEFYASRMDKEWGLTDCISFIVMKEKKLTDALATDHHFEQAGFTPFMRKEGK